MPNEDAYARRTRARARPAANQLTDAGIRVCDSKLPLLFMSVINLQLQLLQLFCCLMILQLCHSAEFRSANGAIVHTALEDAAMPRRRGPIGIPGT